MAYQHKTAWGASANPAKKTSFKEVLESAPLATNENPYLKRKKIQPHNTGQLGENLLVPVYVGLEITGLQTISPNGEKKFVAGSEVSGGYYAINPENDKSLVYIAEGFATASTIAETTGVLTLCAFSAGNLPKCASFVRTIYKDAKIVMCADDDQEGIKYAEKAACEIDGFVAYSKDKKDFNDLFCDDVDITELLSVHVKPEKKIEPERIYKDYTHLNDSYSEEQIKDMLSHINADCGYHDWIEIGMALKAGGFGMSFWDDWSKSSSKYKKGDCYTHWQSFRGEGVSIGSLVYHAQLGGWKARYEPKEDVGIPVDIQAMLENSKNKVKKLIEKPFVSSENVRFEGLIQETVDWIVSCSQFEQPLLATLNTIAVLGAIFGRRYETELETRSNIYMVGVAGTSAGKDHSRKCLIKLCKAAGLLRFIGDDGVRSDSGIVKSLKSNISQVMMIDEFGMFLQGIKDFKAPSHIKAVGKLLIQLYSTSSSTYKHGTYATDKMESMQLECPNLCIYGTTTEEVYARALTKEGIKSGELNRFIVLPSGDTPPPNHRIVDRHPPPELIEKWKTLANEESNSLAVSNANAFELSVEKMKWGETWDEVCRMMDFQYEKRNDTFGALYGRYRENIIKIAMVYCLSEGKTVFENKHFIPAKQIVERAIQYMIILANRHMAENQWEGLYNEFIEVIAASGGTISRSELQKRMKKMKRRDFGELFQQMMDTEVITTFSVSPKDGLGRPTVHVKLI